MLKIREPAAHIPVVERYGVQQVLTPVRTGIATVDSTLEHTGIAIVDPTPEHTGVAVADPTPEHTGVDIVDPW